MNRDVILAIFGIAAAALAIFSTVEALNWIGPSDPYGAGYPERNALRPPYLTTIITLSQTANEKLFGNVSIQLFLRR
jgi:hypothetical protein